MFRKIHNRKGQNTAEYAILISLVVAGIIAMQTYAQRALQGRVQAASTLLSDQGTKGTDTTGAVSWKLDSIEQYEPYYLDSNYTIARDSREEQRLSEGTANAIRLEEDVTRTRSVGGYQESAYNATLFGEAWDHATP
jgi:Flp pilus assembly pilin Flp